VLGREVVSNLNSNKVQTVVIVVSCNVVLCVFLGGNLIVVYPVYNFKLGCFTAKPASGSARAKGR